MNAREKKQEEELRGQLLLARSKAYELATQLVQIRGTIRSTGLWRQIWNDIYDYEDRMTGLANQLENLEHWMRHDGNIPDDCGCEPRPVTSDGDFSRWVYEGVREEVLTPQADDRI